MTSKIPVALTERYYDSFSEKVLVLSVLLDELSKEADTASEKTIRVLRELHHFIYQLNSSAVTYDCKELSSKTREFLKLMEQGEVSIPDVLSCGQQLIQLLQYP